MNFNIVNVVKCWMFCLGVALIWGIVVYIVRIPPIISAAFGVMIGYASMTWAMIKWDVFS